MRPSPPDPRDYRISRFVAGAPSFPNAYKTIETRPAIDDQGASERCVGFGLGLAVDIHESRERGTWVQHSEDFIYQNREEWQHQGEGMHSREALAMLKKWGTCPRSMMPAYMTYRGPSVITDAMRAAAVPQRVAAYARLWNDDEVRTAMMTLGPVNIVIGVYRSFDDCPPSGMLAVPNIITERYRGLHMVTVIEWMPDPTGLFPFRYVVANSWGTDEADGGYYYFPPFEAYGIGSGVTEMWSTTNLDPAYPPVRAPNRVISTPYRIDTFKGHKWRATFELRDQFDEPYDGALLIEPPPGFSKSDESGGSAVIETGDATVTVAVPEKIYGRSAENPDVKNYVMAFVKPPPDDPSAYVPKPTKLLIQPPMVEARFGDVIGFNFKVLDQFGVPMSVPVGFSTISGFQLFPLQDYQIAFQCVSNPTQPTQVVFSAWAAPATAQAVITIMPSGAPQPEPKPPPPPPPPEPTDMLTPALDALDDVVLESIDDLGAIVPDVTRMYDAAVDVATYAPSGKARTVSQIKSGIANVQKKVNELRAALDYVGGKVDELR